MKRFLTLISLIPNLYLHAQVLPEQEKKPDSLSTKVFQLGEVQIIAPEKDDLSGRVSAEVMQAQNRFEVSRVLPMLAGVNISTSGQRNESMVSVRGFDLKAVPVYMDGIPVYVPYDGYVDLGRFTTFDLSAIDVSKGFSSMLYGPNSLGGAINLISRKPVQKIEWDAALGIINTNGYRANANWGAKFKKIYVQGGISYLHRDGFGMSKEYKAHAHEQGGQRDNSYRTDQKLNLKIGWTPNEKHEYVLGYINQQGEKGNPVYAGDDSLNAQKTKPRYWQWPKWNKETVYFISRTELPGKSYVKSRLYYDIFTNSLNSFDDSTFTTQKKPYAFQSFYNDYTYGGMVELGTGILPGNELKASIQYKEDIHRENNLNEPVRKFEDNTLNFAVENIYRFARKWMIIPGISYSQRKNLRAEDYNSKTNVISDYPGARTSAALNYQLGVFYDLGNQHKINATASRKTRFATFKDRYSYRMGTAIPNPDLKPEMSDNFDITYSGKVWSKVHVQASVFYSQLSNAILSVSNVQPGKSQMQNTGRAVFKGIELAMHYQIMPDLLLASNYSYIERVNQTNPSVFFTDVPYSKVFSFIQYKLANRYQFMLSSEYNSLRYSTSYGTRAPGFHTANFLASVSVLKWMKIEAGVNNLFDKNYMYTEGYPEEGRNFFVTLRFFNHP